MGIDMDQYLFRMDGELHHILHGSGGVLRDMTKKWGDWIAKNGSRLEKLAAKNLGAAREEVLAYGQKLREEAGLGHKSPDAATPAETVRFNARRDATR
jgi:hypothetical protein